ncbi:hypothetical protein [Blastococcus brunescens]|uniref:Uncharacterized protein n=1 Tax=Blastococcus brunescens TaxID=1564165 RepID=A0ABZ1BBI6_9ACTN|nr:hypothetical protein [Blastococcus sp. BMG 8361]WRL67024.1 hypothetical protein U6N30_16365 [Blastococcus sp. BMG 8361]
MPVGDGPEDVVDAGGRVLTGLSDGRIARIDRVSGTVETVARVPGRPLGLELLGGVGIAVAGSVGNGSAPGAQSAGETP